MCATIEAASLPTVGDQIDAMTDAGRWAAARVTSVSSDAKVFSVVWGGGLRASGLPQSRVRRREAEWDFA